MATIRTRRRSDGSLAYLSEIRIKRDGQVVHRESKTFDRMGQARAWAATREKRLAKVDLLKKPTRTPGNAKLRAVLQRYRKEVSEVRTMGRTKTSHIRYLEKCAIARMPACEIEALLPVPTDGDSLAKVS